MEAQDTDNSAIFARPASPWLTGTGNIIELADSDEVCALTPEHVV